MENTAILKNLNQIFKEVLDNEDIQLTDTITANDIDEWDSLAHIQLIVAIERKFEIRFNSMEVGGFKEVGDIVKTIQNKQ